MAAVGAGRFCSRRVAQKVLSVEQREGVGARVRRSIGRPELRNFDPFLMLDEFSVAPPAGFPDHPHRGQSTVTFMFPDTPGAFLHEDFLGHKGVLRAGDLQWMCAGRGIVHSEVPASGEMAHGLQLWVNLAAKDKMCEPSYQELLAKDVPKVTKDGVTATVIAGPALGIESKIYTKTPVHYAMFEMEAGSSLEHLIPRDWNSFIYTIKGTATFGGTSAAPHHTLALDREGDGITVEADSGPATFVVISGKPIGEPVVQHGPFVMNTQAEIRQTLIDYHSGKNGFEAALSWNGTHRV